MKFREKEDIHSSQRGKKAIYSDLGKEIHGRTVMMYTNATLASWARDIEGEESVCRRIRIYKLKVLMSI